MVVLANIAIGFRHEPPIFLKIAAYPLSEKQKSLFSRLFIGLFSWKDR